MEAETATEGKRVAPWHRKVIAQEERQHNMRIGLAVVANMRAIVASFEAEPLAAETRASLKRKQAYVAVLFDIPCKESLGGRITVYPDPTEPGAWCACLCDDLREDSPSMPEPDYRRIRGAERKNERPCLVAHDWPPYTLRRWDDVQLATALVRSLHTHCLIPPLEALVRPHAALRNASSGMPTVVRHHGQRIRWMWDADDVVVLWAFALIDSLLDGSLMATALGKGITGQQCLVMKARTRLAHRRITKYQARILGHAGDSQTERERVILQRMVDAAASHKRTMRLLAKDPAFYANEIEPCKRAYDGAPAPALP